MTRNVSLANRVKRLEDVLMPTVDLVSILRQARMQAISEEASTRFADALDEEEPEENTLAHRVWSARRRCAKLGY
jgi:hypothetical protein